MLTAPKIKNYIECLGFGYESKRWKNVKAVDAIFQLLQRIRPTKAGRFWELWLRAPRGPIEDFGNLEEMLENEQIESQEELRNWWLEEFPEPVVWFRFGAIQETPYRAIFLGNRLVMEERTENAAEFAYDVEDLAQWMLVALQEVVSELDAGTYNDDVQEHLPIQYRTGTILRHHLWDVDPVYRKPFILSSDDLTRFLAYAGEQPDTWREMTERLSSMTANDFYRFCSMGYKANGYPGTDLPLRKQYERHADGRDEGLGDIDPDDPEAFSHWLMCREDHIGHPWEVCQGGNSTHISLQVWKDNSGYLLWLAGKAWSRTLETVRFYLALRDAGLPVFLSEAKTMAKRMTGEEMVGIVPEDVIPAYCDDRFPLQQHILDFMHFPLEYKEQLADKVAWQPVPKVKLMEMREEGAETIIGFVN